MYEKVFDSAGSCGHTVVNPATRERDQVSTIRDHDFSSMLAGGNAQLQFETSGLSSATWQPGTNSPRMLL
jgi:hypothetical protein